MIKMIVTIGLAACLLAPVANAHNPGKRIAIGFACVTADDAFEVGVSIDRKLPSVPDLIHDKIVDGACFVLPVIMQRDDAVLVSVTESAENTDVWEVRTDAGRTLFVAYDREPGV